MNLSEFENILTEEYANVRRSEVGTTKDQLEHLKECVEMAINLVDHKELIKTDGKWSVPEPYHMIIGDFAITDLRLVDVNIRLKS